MNTNEFFELVKGFEVNERTRLYTDYVRKTAEKDEFPCITVIGQEAGCICELLAAMTGTAVSEEIKNSFTESGRLFITNKERAKACSYGAVSNAPLSQRYDIELYLADEYTEYELSEVLADADYCIVALDANRLLTNSERSLIEKYITRMMAPERVKTVCANMDLIVNDSDVDALKNRMKDFCSGIASSMTFDVIDNINESTFGESLPAFSKTREEEAVIYAKAGFAEYLKKKLADCDSGMKYIEEILAKCQANFEKLSRYAKYTSGNITDEVNVQLVFEALKDVDEHICLVEAEIDKAFADSGCSDLKKRAEQVERYIKKCWMKFISDEAAVLEKKIEALAEKEKSQLEEDVANTLGELLPHELECLMDMLHATDPALFPRVDLEEAVKKDPIADESENKKREIARKISKGLMYAAIPAAILIAPSTLIATVGGSVAIKKLIVAKIDGDFAKSAAEAAKKLNKEVAEDVRTALKRNIHRAGEDIADWLGGVYSSGKERLMTLIAEYQEELNRIAENKELINAMILKLENE